MRLSKSQKELMIDILNTYIMVKEKAYVNRDYDQRLQRIIDTQITDAKICLKKIIDL